MAKGRIREVLDEWNGSTKILGYDRRDIWRKAAADASWLLDRN